MNPAPFTLPPDTRRRAAEVADRLTAAVARPEPLSEERSPTSTRWHAQSLSQGAAGISLLHALRGDVDRTGAWVRTATASELAAGGNAGLWYGAASVAFVLRHGAPGLGARVLTRLDAGVDRLIHARLASARARMEKGHRPARAEYDVVLGLAGLGSYLLHRALEDPLLGEVLSYLVDLTHPLCEPNAASGTRPGWWTGALPSGKDPNLFAGGHADLGAAHGITGPLALLALAHQRGVTVPGQAEAIENIVTWLETHRREGPTGGWWPERLTACELTGERPQQNGPRRPSWCYGTPGIARSLQLAALALADTARQERAEADLAACLSDPDQLATLTDPGLCHGWSGVVMTLRCAVSDARSASLREKLVLVTERFLRRLPNPQDPATRPGLIEGLAGAAATAHTLAHQADPSWASCLLIT